MSTSLDPLVTALVAQIPVGQEVEVLKAVAARLSDGYADEPTPNRIIITTVGELQHVRDIIASRFMEGFGIPERTIDGLISILIGRPSHLFDTGP